VAEGKPVVGRAAAKIRDEVAAMLEETEGEDGGGAEAVPSTLRAVALLHSQGRMEVVPLTAGERAAWAGGLALLLAHKTSLRQLKVRLGDVEARRPPADHG
jgi:hypothetical protein